jgi:hypothetical protein
MATFEVEGPCPDGEFFVVRVEIDGDETERTFLSECYLNDAAARAAADRFNANPETAPTE